MDILSEETVQLEQPKKIEPDPTDYKNYHTLLASSCAYWMNDSVPPIRLASGQEFSFKNHEFQFEWYNEDHRNRVYMKATGAGVSECEIAKTHHGMIFGRYKQGVAYWFPTNADMLDYSKSRFNPLYALNPTQIGRYLKSATGKSTDTAGVKRIGNATLYLRGARLDSVNDGEAKVSTKTSGIHVDRNVLDEVDQFDPEALAKIEGRAGHSSVKETAYIGNPSESDFGVDLIFQQSDQRYWHRKCCGVWQCPEEDFPNVPIKNNYQDLEDVWRKTGVKLCTSYIACKVCGKPLWIYNGEGSAQWVAKRPENNKMAGYNWSHLTSVYHDPSDILEKFNNPPQNNLGDVYRLDLGRPYSSREDRLQKNDVLACCGRDSMPDHHTGPCAMGVDVGKTFHVVIGTKTDTDRYEIIRVAQVSNWEELHDLEKRYNVKARVIDIRPYEDSARQYQKEHANTFLCEYTDSALQEAAFNDTTGVVKAYRTGIFDNSHRLISKGNILLPRQNPAIEEFAQQLCNCVKTKVEDKRKSQIIYRYVPTGNQQEHYRNALNYFLLAAYGNRIAKVRNKYRQSTSDKAEMSYKRI